MGSSIAGVIAADRAVQRMSLAYAQAELERLREAMRDGVDVDDSHLADVLDRVRRARAVLDAPHQLDCLLAEDVDDTEPAEQLEGGEVSRW